MPIEVPLTRGYFALVDDDDYGSVMEFNWHAIPKKRKNGTIITVYAYRAVPRPGGGQLKQALHRFILGINPGHACLVDHRDHDGLNCQRGNLRVATGTQNCGNRKRRHDSGSPYKGISFEKSRGKWAAAIKTHGINRSLGRYSDPEAAARAYDAAAREYFGEFAETNFPMEDDSCHSSM